MHLSVIIVNYNVKYFLEQCLHAVIAACKNIKSEIFVVDNASSDFSVEYLKPRFTMVKFIISDKNLGFAKANNKALHVAAGEYVLYLNPDTIIAENILEDCLSFFINHNDAGAVGVKMIDGSGNFLPESKRAFPSILASLWKLSGMTSLFPKSATFNRYALGNLNENEVNEADILAGAFFMSRKNILLELKGFDEDFFMYGEDIDLSYRIQKFGYKNYYLGNISIVHFKGESTKKESPAYVKNFYSAMNIFLDKHYNKQSSSFLKAGVFITEKLAFLKNQLKFRIKHQKINECFNFTLIGSDEDTASAMHFFSGYNYHFEKTACINEQSSFETGSIIFCFGKLKYLEAINFIQKNKTKYTYFWHGNFSNSIVASNSSNTTGKIYADI